MYIKDDKANDRALTELEALLDRNVDLGTSESARIIMVSKAIERYEKWSLDDGKPRAWQLKHPEVTYKKPEHHPDDTNHVRHKLREFYRKAEREQEWARQREESLKKAGRI